MTHDHTLIRQLASGQSLNATDPLLALLSDLGLDFTHEQGKVQLTAPLELLDPNQINQHLTPKTKSALRQLDIHLSLDSTNTYLMNRTGHEDFHGAVCLAERQTAGRGRRGRNWVTPFGRNIAFSLGWLMPGGASSLEGLSLMVGVEVAGSILDCGGPEVGLKWPNDILLGDGKVAGILTEVGNARGGKLPVVIGIGINLQLSEADARAIGQPWAVVHDVSRNRLAAQLANRLVMALQKFSAEGFDASRAHWESLDAFRDREVRVIQGDGESLGVARGVNAQGHLLVENNSGIQAFNAGEVSLRPR